MNFVDEVKIKAKAGDGGRGCVSFRREKFIPDGGPDGGDGGGGGDIIVEVDSGLSTLLDLRYNVQYKAKNGIHGMGKNRHGKGESPSRSKCRQELSSTIRKPAKPWPT